MKISEVRERSLEELGSLLTETRRNLWKARFDNYSNQLDDTASIRRLRRDIAKILTVQKEKSQAPKA